jgi:hypothetical protein
VYAFSFDREIGVDLEAVRAVTDRDDIAAPLFFLSRERGLYYSLDCFKLHLR